MTKTNSIREEIKTSSPLIHCITNPISINQCANSIISLGARPIMAEHPKEVKEITSSADALFLNLGNITDARMKSIRISFREAVNKKIPTVIDAVGVACSTLRRKYINKLLKSYTPTVIKGNYSEIVALYDSAYISHGVDSDKTLSTDEVKTIAEKLSVKYGCIILASGQTDIVSENGNSSLISGGTPHLSSVTGTGCMLGAICACFLSVNQSAISIECACRFFKECGVKAQSADGSGGFTAKLIDAIGGAV